MSFRCDTFKTGNCLSPAIAGLRKNPISKPNIFRGKGKRDGTIFN